MQVFNELLAEIESIPAIDVCSQVDPDSPAASDLSEIVLSPEMQAEVIAAGAPPDVLESAGASERLEAAWPHLAATQNTAAHWRLAQITEDLLECEHVPHETTLEEVQGKFDAKRQTSGWAESVLDRGHVSKALALCSWHREIPAATDRFLPVVRLDALVNEPFTRKVLDKLSEVTDQTVYEAGDINKAITALFEKAESAGAVAVNASFVPQVDFEPGNRDSADRVLALVMLGQKTDRDDRRALRSYVMDQVLEACAECKMSFQLILGARRAADDRAITTFDTAMVAGYTQLTSRHSRVTLDVIPANRTLAGEFAAAARSYSNVCVSGAWSFAAFPASIREMLRERIEMLPMNRSCALTSGANCAEWVYAGAVRIRRELAMVLADMVNEQYITRGGAIEVARCYLSENPRRIYKIG